MRGGHNKKSTARHEKEGTLNATKHRRNVVDVPPVASIPPAPKDFDATHSAKWSEVCGLLFESGVLARQDIDSVRTYVEASVAQRKAWSEMNKTGIWDDERGRMSAAAIAYERFDKIVKPLREQFGFTPRTRQSLELTPPDEPTDVIMEILNAN